MMNIVALQRMGPYASLAKDGLICNWNFTVKGRKGVITIGAKLLFQVVKV